VTHEPLPSPGDVIDAWPWYGEGDPRSVGIGKVAPIRGWTVGRGPEDGITLFLVSPNDPRTRQVQVIPRASAWRRAR
jgi:hypothetical protein